MTNELQQEEHPTIVGCLTLRDPEGDALICQPASGAFIVVVTASEAGNVHATVGLDLVDAETLRDWLSIVLKGQRGEVE